MDETTRRALIERLSHQAADLVNKAQLAPDMIAELYLETGLALARLAGATPRDLAAILREYAAQLDQDAAERN